MSNPFIYVDEYDMQREGSPFDSMNHEREYTRKWLVVVNDRRLSAAQVCFAPGVPRPYTPYIDKTGMIHDIGMVSLMVTIVGVLGALLIWRVALAAGANFLFERPDAFWIAPKKAAATLQAAE